MSDRLPGTRPLSGRHEPPPIPSRHEPPPVPSGERELGISGRHEPPPIPATYQLPSISRDEQPIAFVVEESHGAEIAGPIHSDFQLPLAEAVEIEFERTVDEVVVTAGPRPTGEPSSFLPWLALSLALVCLPVSIVAAVVFVLGFQLWPFVLICSLLAVCFGRYARDRGGPSANLAGLAVQLGRGFFAIALIGLAIIGVSVAIWGIATVQSVNKSWQESNAILRWGTEQVEAVKGLFTDQKTNDSAVPSPSAAPTSSP